mgnify:CR=1 FL=1
MSDTTNLGRWSPAVWWGALKDRVGARDDGEPEADGRRSLRRAEPELGQTTGVAWLSSALWESLAYL